VTTTAYVIWQRKKGAAVPGYHLSSADANTAIARIQRKDPKAAVTETFDVLTVTIG
jgi:hypothetical protein